MYKTSELANLAFADASMARPDIVLVHGGTNDVPYDWDYPAETVRNAVDELHRGVDELLRAAPNATILVAQIMPADCPAVFDSENEGLLPMWAIV